MRLSPFWKSWELRMSRAGRIRARPEACLIVGTLLAATLGWNVVAAPPIARRALLVGIDTYPNLPKQPLQGCTTDVRNMRDALIRYAGFADEDIRVLLNEHATHDGIVAAFREHLVAKASGALVVFYFSGHGSATMDVNGDERAHAGYDWWDETLIPYDSRNGSGPEAVYDITDDEFQALLFELYRTNVQHAAVLMDSCGSGVGISPFAEPGESYRELLPDWDLTRNSPAPNVPRFDNGMFERRFQSMMSLPVLKKWADEGRFGAMKASEITPQFVQENLEVLSTHLGNLTMSVKGVQPDLKNAWISLNDVQPVVPPGKDAKKMLDFIGFESVGKEIKLQENAVRAHQDVLGLERLDIPDKPTPELLNSTDADTNSVVKGADWDDRIYPESMNFPKPDWGAAGSSTNMPVVFVFAAQVGQLARMTIPSGSTEQQSVMTYYFCRKLAGTPSGASYEDLIASVADRIKNNHAFKPPQTPGAVGKDSKASAFWIP